MDSDQLVRALQSRFPHLDQLIYLNHAAVSPWPAVTQAAVERFARENALRGARDYPKWMETERRLRHLLARLINAPDASDIALVKNTSEALSFVAYGLSWRAGDNIVTSDQEFPSNRIVWESLASQGVELRQVDLASAETPEEALLNHVDERTRLLTISSIEYASGLRLDLEPLGQYCRNHHIYFCVDAIQSLGAVEVDAQAIQADFLMADGHKWMLGPEGLALFYCRAGIRDELKLNQYGWHMVDPMGDYDSQTWHIAASARRFECGSPNMLGIHALEASISLLLDEGMGRVEAGVLENARYLMEEIDRRPHLRRITDASPGRHGGIVTFKAPGCDHAELYRQLMASDVICAHRGGGIRFSPHFYTPKAQIDRALEKVDALTRL